MNRHVDVDVTKTTDLLEVVELLLQDLDLLQVGAHLLVGEGALLLVDPLLQLVGLAEQHELLAALLQHVLTFLSELQQGAVPEKDERRRGNVYNRGESPDGQRKNTHNA